MSEYNEIEPEEQEIKPKTTPFQSPVPFIIKFRNFIFGKTKPDIYTRVTFFSNLVIWATFFIWHCISYFTITSRTLILRQKGIPVERIIEKRGAQLEFTPGDFLNRLLTFHAISIICWALVFLGLVLLFRKRKQFSYFILGAITFYLGMNVFYLSFTYFMEDTTAYDKIALLVLVASIIFHTYLMKNERLGGSISFFGEANEAEEFRSTAE